MREREREGDGTRLSDYTPAASASRYSNFVYGVYEGEKGSGLGGIG